MFIWRVEPAGTFSSKQLSVNAVGVVSFRAVRRPQCGNTIICLIVASVIGNHEGVISGRCGWPIGWRGAIILVIYRIVIWIRGYNFQRVGALTLVAANLCFGFGDETGGFLELGSVFPTWELQTLVRLNTLGPENIDDCGHWIPHPVREIYWWRGDVWEVY